MIIIKARRCLNLKHRFITMCPGRVQADNNIPLIYNVIKSIWANTDQHGYIIKISELGKGKRVTAISRREMQQQKQTQAKGSRINTDRFLKRALN